MTKDEIRGLLNSQIKGQGNQVDLGGVLPEVLKAVVDLIPDPIEGNTPLKFTAKGAATLGIDNEVGDEENHPVLYKSLDGKTWEDWDYSDISLADGESVYIKGDNPNGFNRYDDESSDEYISTFTITGEIYCEGNIMSLLGENIKNVPYESFIELFEGCNGLLSAPELPATTLSDICYSAMFKDCTSLVNAPELPATTLASSCYSSMFEGCTSLINAPELPATTLSGYCYSAMFEGCTSLVNAPELPATTLSDSCYSAMFEGCTSLINAPELPATTLVEYCYIEMFKDCTSLVNTPELPATTLSEYCYSAMFEGCSILNNITIYATDISGNRCIDNWLKNAAASGVIKCDPSMVATFEADANTPAGWTVEAIS